MDHLGLFVSLNPMTSVLRRDSRKEDTEKRKRPCFDKGRDWSSAARSSGAPGVTRTRKMQERIPPGACRGSTACRHIDSGLPPSKTIRSVWLFRIGSLCDLLVTLGNEYRNRSGGSSFSIQGTLLFVLSFLP